MKAMHEIRKYDSNLPPSFQFTIFKTKNFSYYAHWHIEVEILYVQKGSIIIGINQDKKKLTRGEFAVFSSGVIHYYENCGEESEIIILIFHPELAESPTGWPFKSQFINPFITGENKVFTREILSIMQKLFSEYKLKSDNYQMMVNGKLIELCVLLERKLPSVIVKEETGMKKKSFIHTAKKTILYLENNFQNDIKLSDLSIALNMNASHLSKIFNEITRMNIRNYINRLRLEKADELIQASPDRKIIDIALECGFNSIRTYNRARKNLQPAIKPFQPQII